MRRLLKYAAVFAFAVVIGLYIVLGPLVLDDDRVPGPVEREAPAANFDLAPPAPPASPASVDEEVAKRIALETRKAERRFLADKTPTPSNPEASSSAPSDARAATASMDPVSSASGDAAPAMAATAVSNDAAPDAKPVNEAARPAAPLARTDFATGTQLAALAPDEICQRDGERLEQLRSNPSSDELVRFANELGCKKLLPQLVSLMKSLAPSPAASDVSNAAPSGAEAVNEAARPPSPHAGADPASSTADQTCKRDEDRLARLRVSPSGEEAQRFASELSCDALRPQLQRLMESLGLAAPAPSGPANSSLSSEGLLTQVCVNERAALNRLRKEPSAVAAGLFWRDLHCEGLRPQVHLLLESLNVAPESVGSAVAPGEMDGAAGAASDAPTPNGADPVACRRETAELNRIRATPDLSDAKRFASAVTCDTLKPQAARLLDSLRE
jgi:hypothetical protein